MAYEALDERSRKILSAVIQSYINSPEPVGSRFVTKRFSFGVSPATIRNVMADLEDLGFLNQPHTSAGRVPTDKGYRFFVDGLLARGNDADQSEESRELTSEFTRRFISFQNDINRMFAEVTHTLSELSNYVGVVLPPKTGKTTFKKIDLIRYRSDTAVAILLTEEGFVRNQVFAADSSLTQGDLNRIAEYLNAEYAGVTLDEMRRQLIQRVRHEKVLWDDLIARAIIICEQALSFSESELFVSGLYDAMNLPDFSDISRIKELSRAIREKHLILQLLDELSTSGGVKVLIGNENPISEFRKMSIVAATYKERERPMGVIALIGPTRMNYDRAIFMVEAMARCVSHTFEASQQ